MKGWEANLRADAIRAAGFVEVTDEDRLDFAAALILQGYEPDRAAALATGLEHNDGALQMLARARLGRP